MTSRRRGPARSGDAGAVATLRALVALTAILAVAFLVLLGFRIFGSGTPGRDDASVAQSDRAVAATRVAKEATAAFLHVDYHDVRAGVEKVLALSTGTFHDQYAKNADALTRAAQQGKIVSRGRVRQVGLSEMSARSAVAYVAADSTIANAAIAAAKARGQAVNDQILYRVRVDLVRVHDRWMVAGLVFVP